MKKIITRSIVLLAIVALVFGSLPTDSAQAAKKKSKTSITVSTQEELVKALKSGKYKKITIKTDAKVSFTVAAKYSNSDLKIVVDAKNATFNSKGTVGSIVVNEAKTVKEYASGNNITVNDEKLTFKAMEGASVEKLKIASETGEVKVVNNGDIGRVDVTGESKVDVEQNGSVGRLYVAAAAEIGVTGTSEEKLAVTVKPEAAGAAVKSELPVKVNAYADVDLQLEKGAENSAVTLKNEDAGVKLENNTDKKVTVTDSDGEKQTVKKGEDLTSDNYVGKPDEPETTDGTVTEQPKEEEQKEEEKKEDKEEEKKDDTTTETVVSGGDSSGGGSYLTPQEQLQSALKSAGRGYENAVVMSSNVTLNDNLTIPSGVCLCMNGCTLNASIYKINLEHEAAINVESQSKLYVGAKNIVLGNDENDFCYGEIGLYPGCEFKYGDALFTAENKDGDDGWTGWISMEKRKEEFRDDRDPNNNFHYLMTDISIWVEGKKISIEGSNNLGADDLPKVFGDNACWTGEEWPISQEGDEVTVVRTAVQPNVRYDTQEITFAGQNGALIDHVNTDEDWINAYLNPGLTWSAELAIEDGKKKPDGISYTDTDGKRIVTITNQTTTIKKGIWVQRGSTLIGKDFVVDFRENQKVAPENRSKFFGQENYDPQGITVFGEGYDEEGRPYGGATLQLTGITSAVTPAMYEGEQVLIDLRGNGSMLKWDGKTYKVDSTDADFIRENWSGLQYKCWDQSKADYSFQIRWEGIFKILGSTDGGTNFDQYFQNPATGDLVPYNYQIVAEDTTQLWNLANSTSRWTNWEDTNTIAASAYNENQKEIIRNHINFTEATIDSNATASGEYGGKKPLVVEPVLGKDGEGNDFYDEVCICGMDIRVADHTTIVLEPDARISLNRGANLTIDGVSYEKGAGKMLCLLPGVDGQDSGRIDVKWGASITIGGIVFQTENNDGSWDDGRIGLSLDVVKDWKGNTSVRIQLGEGVTIKKTDGTYPTAEELNNLGLKVDIQTPLSVTRDDEMTDEEKEALHQKQALEFPSIKLGDNELFNDRDGRWEIGEYTKAADSSTFTTDSVAGLKAIAKVIEPDHRGDNGTPIWASIHYTGTGALFNDITMRLPATVYFDVDDANIQITNGAKLTFSIVTGANSLVNIGADCVLGTTQGGNSVIGGRLVLGERATIRSQMDSALVIVTGGAFELGSGGVFECGCVRFIDENQGDTTAIWFENNGGTIDDRSEGEILLIDMGSTPVDMDACVAQVRAIVSGSSIRVIPGTINIPQNGEPQQGQPGQQQVVISSP